MPDPRPVAADDAGEPRRFVTRVSWAWIAVSAGVLLIGVPVALGGLYATGDL